MKKILLSLLLAGTCSLQAQVALTTEHVDIGLAEGPGLGIHWHDEDNDLEYEPDGAYAFIDPVLALNTRPAASQWNFLGGTVGGNIWILPQTQNPNLLYLGVGAEEADAGTFDLWNPGDARGANNSARWLELSLVSVSGPGAFSVWQTDQFGSPIAYISTAETLTGGNRLFVQEGGHSHYNWGFTSLGTYDVTFQVRGFIGGDEVTQQDIFTFSTSVIPEPSTYALLGLGLAAIILLRRRNKNAST